MDTKSELRPDRRGDGAAIAACGLPYAFMMDGALWVWFPRQGRLGFIMEDDEREYRKCETFLKSRKRVFSSIDEVARFALGAGWPGSDKIVASYNGWSKGDNLAAN
jgi:hypothetical protein